MNTHYLSFSSTSLLSYSFFFPHTQPSSHPQKIAGRRLSIVHHGHVQGINMDICKVTTSSYGPKTQHLLVLSVLCPDTLTYLIHSFMLWLSQLYNKGFRLIFTETHAELLPKIVLHNWLHLMGLCMLKCHAHKCNLCTLLYPVFLCFPVLSFMTERPPPHYTLTSQYIKAVWQFRSMSAALIRSPPVNLSTNQAYQVLAGPLARGALLCRP